MLAGERNENFRFHLRDLPWEKVLSTARAIFSLVQAVELCARASAFATMNFSKVFATVCCVMLSSSLAVRGLKSPATKVIGGQDASPGEFPYVVSVQWNFGNGSRAVHFCGGTIVSAGWILTAAHCRETTFDGGWLEVVAGEFDLRREEGFEQRRNASKFLVHESRAPGFVGPFDIALIKLDRPLLLTGNVSTIPLDNRSSPMVGYAMLPGWGAVTPTVEPDYPGKLQKVNLPVYPYDACLQYFPLFSPLEESNFCAGELSGSANACHRDSGGPLIQTVDGVETQVGLVSWGAFPCSAYRSPTVITWISKFRDWVRMTIERDESGNN